MACAMSFSSCAGSQEEGDAVNQLNTQVSHDTEITVTSALQRLAEAELALVGVRRMLEAVVGQLPVVHEAASKNAAATAEVTDDSFPGIDIDIGSAANRSIPTRTEERQAYSEGTEVKAPAAARDADVVKLESTSDTKMHAVVCDVPQLPLERDIKPTPQSILSRSFCEKIPVTHAPERAFVINARRLMDVREKIILFHTFFDCTSVAALTLVAAASPSQVLFTMVFLAATAVMFILHQYSWDTFDAEDLNSLLPLLTDDIDTDNLRVRNPNRLLKTLTTTASRFARIRDALGYVFGLVAVVFGWCVLNRYWYRENAFDTDRMPGGETEIEMRDDNILDKFINTFLIKEDDLIIMGMQVTVATILFVLHVSFEFVKNYECGAVMPTAWETEGTEKVRRVWDPRRDGAPFWYRLMGMPAMWFTSEEVLADLITYVSAARKVRVKSICPQEIALLVLASEDGRKEVQSALQHSKLYSAEEHHLVHEDDSHGMSRFKPLDIELVFFDEELHSPGFKFPGEFSGLSEADGGTESQEVRSIVTRTERRHGDDTPHS